MQINYSTGKTPLSIVSADFNNDKKFDLAVTNNDDNTISVLLGKGDGTFQSQIKYSTNNAPASITSYDFNGDGKSDLAVANFGSNDISIFLNECT